MPELPEVERARGYVHSHCVGKKVVNVEVAQDTIVYDGIAPNAFAAHLKDKTFKDSKRRGKHFWVVLDEGPHPLFHLGMTGKFIVRSPAGELLKAEMKHTITEDKGDHIVVGAVKGTTKDKIDSNVKKNNNGTSENNDKFESSADDDFEKLRGDKKKANKEEKTEENFKETKNIKKKRRGVHAANEKSLEDEPLISETEWPPKWYKLIIEFDDGTKVAFSDPRRLGRIRVRTDPATEEPIRSLGYDPILDDIDNDAFNTMVLKRKVPIKALLLDQTVFAGVGNWIADEVLYQSSIHPAKLSNTLTTEELSNLKKNVKDVIQTAVNVGANWRQFPTNWLFHFRWDKAKKTKKHVTSTGEAIEFVTVGGRTSAVVTAKQIPPVDFDPNSKKKGKKRKKNDNDSAEDLLNEEETTTKRRRISLSKKNKNEKTKKMKNKAKKSNKQVEISDIR